MRRETATQPTLRAIRTATPGALRKTLFHHAARINRTNKNAGTARDPGGKLSPIACDLHPNPSFRM